MRFSVCKSIIVLVGDWNTGGTSPYTYGALEPSPPDVGCFMAVVRIGLYYSVHFSTHDAQLYTALFTVITLLFC